MDVDLKNLLNDSTMVGNTFLDDLFESNNNGYSSMHLLNGPTVEDEEEEEEGGLMQNNQISRIIPIHEQSNELEESSGLLGQLVSAQEGGDFDDFVNNFSVSGKSLKAKNLQSLRNSSSKKKKCRSNTTMKTIRQKMKKTPNSFRSCMSAFSIKNFYDDDNDSEQILHFFEPKSKNFYYLHLKFS